MKYLSIVLLAVLFVSGCNKHSDPIRSASPPANGDGQPVRVSNEGADAAEPAIAVSPDGTVYVAWVSHGPGGKADVMFARFNSNKMQGAPVQVNPSSVKATAWRGDPPTIIVGPDQAIFIGWTAKVESDGARGTDLFVSASRDQGRTFDAPVRVNDDKKPVSHGMHSLAAANDGRLYVAWLDERNVAQMPAMDHKLKQQTGGQHVEANSEVFIASSSDNGRTFSPNSQVAKDACPCCKTALTTSKDGKVFLSWRQVLPGNFRHIAVAASSDRGQTFSESKIVSDDQWMLAGCPVSGPALAVSKEGILQVLWFSAGKNGETGLYSSESKDGANSFGPRILIAAGEVRGNPVLTDDGKQLIAVWEGARGVSTSPLNAGQSKVSSIVDGGLPAAVGATTGLVAAYISKPDQARSIWIITSAYK